MFEMKKLDSGVWVPPDYRKSDVSKKSTLLRRVGEPLRPIRGGAASLFIVYNSALATTAAPVSQPTGTAIRTMLQISPNANNPIRVIEWGISFDGSAAATPGKVELVDTTSIFATMSTAYANADIQPYNMNAVTYPQTGATTAAVPLQIGSALSGFATAAVTEGTTTATRMGDLQLLPPTAPYVKQYPLGREFEQGGNHALRVRVTFGTTVNCFIYLIIEG